MLSAVGDVMVNTTSNLYTGLSLIGYTVETNTQTNGTAGCFIGCGQELAADCANNSMTAAKNCITDTSGTGILAIIGIAGLMSIINQFVRFWKRSTIPAAYSAAPLFFLSTINKQNIQYSKSLNYTKTYKRIQWIGQRGSKQWQDSDPKDGMIT